MTKEEVAAEIEAGQAFLKTLPGVRWSALIGSAFYLPETAKDIDFAVLLDKPEEDLDAYALMLCDELDFKACTEYDIDAGWFSVRRGQLNLMITSKREFYDGYLLSMEVCKVLRLEHKIDRIHVCQVVRDGKTAEELKPWPAYVDVDMRHTVDDVFVDTEHERLAKLVLELAEACDNAAADIGGSRGQLDILRDAVVLAERFKKRTPT